VAAILNGFAENQLISAPENNSFEKIWGSKYLAWPPGKFLGVIWLPDPPAPAPLDGWVCEGW